MRLKKAYHWLIYRFFEADFLFLETLSKFLPPPLFEGLSAPMLKLLIHFLVPRRRIKRNLQAAFGATLSPATIKGLAKGVQEHFVKNLYDCFCHMANPDRTRQTVTIEGSEHVRAALAKGKGVIGLGAQIGNVVLVGASVGMERYRV